VNTFTPTLAKQLTESTEPFPVDFDEAWVWLDYSQKGHAKVSFQKASFQDGIDFLRKFEKSTGGRPAEKIYLTTDALKHFAMMANTKKGHEVRQYMIEAEKTLRAAMQAVKPTAPPTHSEALRGWADEIDRNEALTKQLEAAQPAVDFVSHSVEEGDAMSFGDAAKILNLKTPDGRRIGRTLLKEGLRRMGVFLKQGQHEVPYQEHLNAGRFVVKYNNVDFGGYEIPIPTTKVKPSGLMWIRRKFINGGCTEA